MTKTDDPDPIVSGTVLGTRWGVTSRSVTELAKKGIAVRAEAGGYHEHASTLRYMQHLRKAAAGRSGISDRRAQLIDEQTTKLKIENGIKRNSYWKAAEIIREWALTWRELCARMLAIPDRLASRLPHLTRHDLHEIDQEIRIVLQETYDAHDPVKGFSASDTPKAERDANDETKGTET